VPANDCYDDIEHILSDVTLVGLNTNNYSTNDFKQMVKTANSIRLQNDQGVLEKLNVVNEKWPCGNLHKTVAIFKTNNAGTDQDYSRAFVRKIYQINGKFAWLKLILLPMDESDIQDQIEFWVFLTLHHVELEIPRFAKLQQCCSVYQKLAGGLCIRRFLAPNLIEEETADV
jgi:hypothetical protein